MKDPFVRIVVFIALCITIITAINSKGFLNNDEHFQIIEFAGLKLGYNTKADLAWEYTEQIRPAIQPILAEVFIRSQNLLGVESQFSQIRNLRIATGLFMLFCMLWFYRYARLELPKHTHRLFLVLSLFLFYIPFLSVRFSSESLSAGLMLLVLGFVLKVKYKLTHPSSWTWIWCGLLLGLIFIVRFQMAFMIMGLLIWMKFFLSSNWGDMGKVAIGMVLALVFGACADYYFYEEWVFPAYNYFYVNLIEDKVSTFGVSPWYGYLKDLMYLGYASGLAVVLLVFSAIGLVFKPTRLLTFAIVPFLVVHFLIGHKELRFLIPVFFLIPFIFVQGWVVVSDYFTKPTLNKPVYIVAVLLFAGNCIGLAVNSVKPADGTALVYEFVVEERPDNTLLYREGPRDFPKKHASLNVYFYSMNLGRTKKIPNRGIELSEIDGMDQDDVFLARDTFDPTDYQLREIAPLLPRWIIHINIDSWMRIKNCDWVFYESSNYPAE